MLGISNTRFFHVQNTVTNQQCQSSKGNSEH